MFREKKITNFKQNFLGVGFDSTSCSKWVLFFFSLAFNFQIRSLQFDSKRIRTVSNETRQKKLHQCIQRDYFFLYQCCSTLRLSICLAWCWIYGLVWHPPSRDQKGFFRLIKCASAVRQLQSQIGACLHFRNFNFKVNPRSSWKVPQTRSDIHGVWLSGN